MSSASSAARVPPLTPEVLERLRQNAASIRISYSTTKLLIHFAVILALVAEYAALLSSFSLLDTTHTGASCPAAQRAPSGPYVTAQAAVPTHQAMSPAVWAPRISGPLAPIPFTIAPKLADAWALVPNWHAILAPLPHPVSASPAAREVRTRHQYTVLFTLLHMVLGLVSATTYAPAIDKLVHVYGSWPLTYFTLELPCLVLAAGGAEALGAAGLTWTQVLTPLFASLAYHLYLRRFLVAVRLWQHSRSFPHLHSATASGGRVGLAFATRRSSVRLPGVHPLRLLASQMRQLAYHTYSLVAPYACQLILLAAAPAVHDTWRPVSLLGCAAAWALHRMYVSFHCFQVECLVWNPGRVGKEGVLVWRERERGWQAGVFC